MIAAVCNQTEGLPKLDVESVAESDKRQGSKYESMRFK